MLRRIQQASPIDRRSTNSRSSRLRKRSSEHAQDMEDVIRNMHNTCTEHVGNKQGKAPKSLKIVAQRAPKSSKIVVWRGRRDVLASMLEDVASKMGPRRVEIENVRPTCRTWSSFWRQVGPKMVHGGHLGLDLGGFGIILGARWAILGPTWSILGLTWEHLDSTFGSWTREAQILKISFPPRRELDFYGSGGVLGRLVGGS